MPSGSGETVYAPWMRVLTSENESVVLIEEQSCFVLIQPEQTTLLIDFFEEFV